MCGKILKQVIIAICLLLGLSFCYCLQASADGGTTNQVEPEQTITMSIADWNELKTEWAGQKLDLAQLKQKFTMLNLNSEEQLKQLDRYAQALGLAFQVRDDMLDVISSDQELGKPVGSDRANEKSTFVNALGLENCAQLVEELSQQAAEALAEFEQPEFLVWLAHALAERKQ